MTPSEVNVLWDAQATLGEGTCWSVAEQALYWVDILGRRLHRWHAQPARCATWLFDSEISTVAECADGSGLVVALRHGFAHFNPGQGGTPQCLHQPAGEPAGNRFNDGKCDAQGRFWCGSMDMVGIAPTGHLYSLDLQGQCRRHALGFAVTNGPAWSLDGRTMWVNDTVQGMVHAFDVDPTTGALSNMRPWLHLAPEDGLPDGMTVDADGTLWLCHWGGGCVTAHHPLTAHEMHRIVLPASQITNCAFGGADLRTLFITSARQGLDATQLAREPLAGALFGVRLPRRGRPAARFGGGETAL